MELNINVIVGVDYFGEYVVLERVFDHGNNFRGATGSRFIPISESRRRYETNIEVAMEYFADIWEGMYSERPGFNYIGNEYVDGEDFPSLFRYTQDTIDCEGEEAIFDLSYYDVGCKIAEMHTEKLAKEKGLTVEQFKSEHPDDVCEISECTGGGRCFTYNMDWEEIFDKQALKLALSFEKLADHDKGWEKVLSKHLSKADIEGIKSRMVAA